MGKAPAFQFYPGDWVQDTRPLSLAAKGAWIDLLCAMWRSQTRGSLTMTMVGYSRLIGATVDQTEAVVKELTDMRICEVERDSAGSVTLMSRRMMREEKQREQWTCRQSRRRVTLESRDFHAVSSSSSTSPPPPTPSDETRPGSVGGGGGDFDCAERPEPQQPPDQSRPRAFDDETWDRIVSALPAIRRRGVSRAAIERLAAGQNGKTAIMLAVIAEACADQSVRAPLAVVSKRVESGARPETISAARNALRETAATPNLPPPPPIKPPSRAEMLEVASRAEASGNAAVAAAARKQAEALL